MIFKPLGARSFRACMIYLHLDHEGEPSKRKARAIDDLIMPLILRSPVLAAVLRKIAAGDFPGMPTMFDVVDDTAHPYAVVLRLIQDEARRALKGVPEDR